MLFNHLILCHFLLFLPSIFSSIRVFSNELAHHIRWPNYWSFSFSISPSNEYSGLISFRIDWLDLFAIQGTFKSLLQHHSSKAILWFSTFFGLPCSSADKRIHLQCRRPQFDSWVRKIHWRRDRLPTLVFLGFPHGSAGKESACNVGDLGLIPGLGRSPGGGYGNSLQYSCLENPHGQRTLEGCSPWGQKESDLTEQLSAAQHSLLYGPPLTSIHDYWKNHSFD